MDTEKHRREQYRLRRVRETPEETKMRRCRSREYMKHQRAAMTAKQRRLRNVQVNTSTLDLVCDLVT